MRIFERDRTILNLLEQRGFVYVDELVRILGVSAATIRRDLNRLQQRGQAERVYGGGRRKALEIGIEQDFAARSLSAHAQKVAIGRVAAELIAEGDVVVIDSGTTTSEIVPHLSRFRNLTVITPGLNIAAQLQSLYSDMTIILTGGLVRPKTNSVVLVPGVGTLELRADKIFLGCAGLDPVGGVTIANLLALGTKRHLVELAREVIVLADGSKFGRVSLAQVVSMDRVGTVVTDDSAPTGIVSRLREMNIRVVQAEACKTSERPGQIGESVHTLTQR